MPIDATFPPLGLRVGVGPLELHGIDDETLDELAHLAAGGIHPPEAMPFAVPWTDAPDDELAVNTAQFHWRCRATFARGAWDLQLAVRHDGELVGTQGVSTSSFLVTRTGETGSWLGARHQGRGLGTAMRRALCALCFDHLDFAEVSSTAFTDNPASLAVSRKVGYSEIARLRVERRPGELAEKVLLVVRPEQFVRPADALVVEGLAPLRAFIGLDADPSVDSPVGSP